LIKTYDGVKVEELGVNDGDANCVVGTKDDVLSSLEKSNYWIGGCCIGHEAIGYGYGFGAKTGG
jgi:hypothetical protein